MKLPLYARLALLTSIVALSACVYRLDIPQGNRIDAQLIAQLETGMTPRQVEFLLGEPAITDPYRANVWHYVYYFKSGETGSIDKRLMTLEFIDNQLSSIDGSLGDS